MNASRRAVAALLFAGPRSERDAPVAEIDRWLQRLEQDTRREAKP